MTLSYFPQLHSCNVTQTQHISLCHYLLAVSGLLNQLRELPCSHLTALTTHPRLKLTTGPDSLLPDADISGHLPGLSWHCHYRDSDPKPVPANQRQ